MTNDDDNEPRPGAAASLGALLKEDLSLLGIEELQDRITALESEIDRVRNFLDSKRGTLSAAEALFKK